MHFDIFQPFKHEPRKMVEHNQTIRRQIADQLFECLTILWDWRMKGLKLLGLSCKFI